MSFSIHLHESLDQSVCLGGRWCHITIELLVSICGWIDGQQCLALFSLADRQTKVVDCQPDAQTSIEE